MAIYNKPTLISIESVSWDPGRHSRSEAPYWKVVMACTNDNGVRFMETTWYIDKKDFDEDNVLDVVHNYVARLFSDLAEQTASWVKTSEQLDAMGKKEST